MITGTAPDQITTQRRDEREPELASKLDGAVVRTQTRDALVSLGWKPAIAKAAVEAAASHAGREATLETWIREALRHCPIRKTS
jgi:Holliday junction resolvasome RuvABC DNA-binding subunit